ncbi:MAG: XRE family transcriptional regulator [Bradymonadales bacterium]|nr:MAG: XRE family transcriptional regulator [Bradymonadales bacterium]
MRRHKSYDEQLADELKDKSFAREYFLGLIEGEDGLDIEDALIHTIRRMGVKEFSEVSGIHEKSISRMINGRVSPTRETLDQYLAPFGLKTKVILEEVA